MLREPLTATGHLRVPEADAMHVYPVMRKIMKSARIHAWKLRLQYYKERFRRRIMDTPAIVCNGSALVEIHALTCERDYIDLIWCLKTFRYYSGLSFHLVIHDDGSLSSQA